MVASTLTEEKIKKLYLEKEEAQKLEGTFCKILNQFYTDLELLKPMPGQTLKSAILLHDTFFSANKLKLSDIEEMSTKADLRKSTFLHQQEEELKEQELKQQEEDRALATMAEKGDIRNDVDKNPSIQTPTNANTSASAGANKNTNVANLDFETISTFLEDKSHAFQLTSIHYLLSLEALQNVRASLQELFDHAQQKQKTKIMLFEKIISQKEQGISLQESLQQDDFHDLVEELTVLGKKMDEFGVANENAFLKTFLHHFKSEPKRNYEMLTLVIVIKNCQNPNIVAFLKKLYKKWPQKNEHRDKRIILEITKQHLNI